MECHNWSVDKEYPEDSLLDEYLNSFAGEIDTIPDLQNPCWPDEFFSLHQQTEAGLLHNHKLIESEIDFLDTGSSIDNLTSASPSPSKVSFSGSSDDSSPKEILLEDDDNILDVEEVVADDTSSDEIYCAKNNYLSVAHTLEIHNYCSTLPPIDKKSKTDKFGTTSKVSIKKNVTPVDLKLTEEEKKLLRKEGYELSSSKGELTPQDEKVLRKIRRKIRNKRSAQFSRQRKKQYVEELEKKYKECNNENKDLKREVEELKKENQSLLTKMRKILQDHPRHGQVSFKTSLCVLILSFLFILIPAFRPDSLDDSLMKNQPEIMNTGRHLLMALAGHESSNDTIGFNDSEHILNYLSTISIESSQNIPLTI
ncbi:uncharacterized protein LOC141855079 [Brevipalpus obovatus]|uniref:uncharacterized protein LOC141855079 n=1 Tax=Brevipalpus obovatus TaxID=246614 RepID=UPI003D9E5F66